MAFGSGLPRPIPLLGGIFTVNTVSSALIPKMMKRSLGYYPKIPLYIKISNLGLTVKNHKV